MIRVSNSKTLRVESGIPIEDIVVGDWLYMVSYWKPTDYELELLKQGAMVELYLNGSHHPSAAVCVGPVPELTPHPLPGGP